GIVTINRPQVRNALNHQTIAELVDALDVYDGDDRIRCMILTGDDRAFAAGADISQMVEAGAVDVLDDDNFARWARFRAIHKPVIAAVSGYALGGGCELALMCDLVVASETAQFGQPEVKIGIIPGAGGTQRWARTAGKVRAMEAVLTGEPVSAVVLTDRNGAVVTLTLNRPDALNALNAETTAVLRAGLEAAGREAAVGAVILTGSGRAFCAGADLKDVSALSEAGDTDLGADL